MGLFIVFNSDLLHYKRPPGCFSNQSYEGRRPVGFCPTRSMSTVDAIIYLVGKKTHLDYI